MSVTYLTNADETDRLRNIDEDYFLDEVKSKFGFKGAKEAQEILIKTAALFAGGELDDDAKEIFFKSLIEVYVESKTEARNKFTPRRRARSKKAI